MSRLPVLRSDRLTLRQVRVSDAEALFEILSDDELMTWWAFGPHRSVEETRAMLEPVAAEDASWRSWAITRTGEDIALGWVNAHQRRENVSEIGYILARSAWGQGIAREAVGRVLDQLLVAEGQRRVFADTDPDNRFSIGLLQKLGFQLEGHLRAEWETHIGVRDTLLFGLLRDEWLAVQQADQAAAPSA
ncbi:MULTISPECIES: GNAT family N-acetyltransferase [Pseudomonadota]|jgi:RimJ/RimL family protein N-acetyltransferase|uniref:GNAT family N-acetyltransferase n=2 Tax=Pseudomonadota TaxID=1224 RepID=UPI00076A1E30|nr:MULTISPECIES: GNAT family N-acetyltransferase [Pseudomonadota]MAF60400.1 N-acetyltransferase [Blastomonas sp.]|tara:strand:+ start:55407 stop:55976 length:570 start_codon:yes stop_codon:yes gene_type:complete